MDVILHYHLPSILAALVLDLLLGDPGWRFHPVRCIGLTASWFEKIFRRFNKNEYINGFLTWFLTLLIFSAIALAIVIIIDSLFNNIFRIMFYGIIIYFCLALRDLYKHGLAVKKALDEQDIDVARKKLALMVSRDTKQLNEQDIIRSVIESISENISDSVIAPILFALFFGPVMAVVYRVINTMDAMFGYKNDTYIKFGFISAKIDDLFNLVPSRLSGILIALFSPLSGGSLKNAFRILIRDSLKHTSPNSGFPEAAVAGALGIQLGGPTSYFGKLSDKPTIGDPLKALTRKHIVQCCIITGIPIAMIILASTLIFLL